MNSSLVVPAIVHLLLVALLAVLPQAELAHPRRATRLGLGLLSGFASLIVTGQATLASDGTGLVVHPVLVGCAAFLWGPASGLVAAAVAVAGHGLASTTEWLQALAVAAASLCLGLVWQELQRRRHLAPALAVVGMAFSLPLVLLPWLADSLVAAWQRAHFPQGWEAILPWRYTLGVLLLAGGANLLRSRAQVLTALARREQDLVRALRASGGGRWRAARRRCRRSSVCGTTRAAGAGSSRVATPSSRVWTGACAACRACTWTSPSSNRCATS